MKKNGSPIFALELYMKWPLLFIVAFILMTIAAFALNFRMGVYMLICTSILTLVALVLYLYSRKGLYTGLIDFAGSFENTSAGFLNDMSTPAAILDTGGKVLWSNTSFKSDFSGTNSSNIQTVFPDITKEITSSLQEASLIHSTFGDRKYVIEMVPSVITSADGSFDALLSAREEDELDKEGDGVEERLTDAVNPLTGEDNHTAALKAGGTQTHRDTYISPEEDDKAPDGKQVIFINVTDETGYVKYKKAYKDSRPCEGIIQLDNYDEALASVDEVRQSLLMALVDRRISGYVNSFNGIVKKLEKDKYFFFINEGNLQKMIEDDFSILDDVKTIKIGNDMFVTLSIGVGKSGKDLNENYEFARAAIEFALGRGGDQAVLKDRDEVIFFGGKTKAQEKYARVKARVKAQALRDLLNTCDKLLIMGHKNADVDSLGAAVGFWRIATTFGKKANIVIGKPNGSLRPIYDRFIESGKYPDDLFISGEEALKRLDDQTMVAVVDVNRPSITEEPLLLKHAGNITVVDHHRSTAEVIENAVLTYIEPYASSACEMISEIIQYMGVNIELTSLEADAMYGGIIIDTQNFVNQTGVRTFEAAAFLKRAGANITRVRKLFRDSYNDYRAKAETIDKAEIYRGQFAFSICNAEGTDSPTVIGAQAANSLLEIDGIKAAVVFTPYQGKIYVSARSIDDVNVQVMMEKIGGGGHMSVAGAQLINTTPEEAVERVRGVVDMMIEKGDIA